LEFEGPAPYKQMVDFGIQFKVKVDPQFSWERQWAVLVDSPHFGAKGGAGGLEVLP